MKTRTRGEMAAVCGTGTTTLLDQDKYIIPL